MTGPTSYLERTRGRILHESERLRVASEVQLISGADVIGHRPRGSIHLALTDRRVLLVTRSWLASRARLLWEIPTGSLSISVTRRRLGGNLIHIDPQQSASLLSFEWVRGHRPRDWETYRFRQ